MLSTIGVVWWASNSYFRISHISCHIEEGQCGAGLTEQLNDRLATKPLFFTDLEKELELIKIDEAHYSLDRYEKNWPNHLAVWLTQEVERIRISTNEEAGQHFILVASPGKPVVEIALEYPQTELTPYDKSIIVAFVQSFLASELELQSIEWKSKEEIVAQVLNPQPIDSSFSSTVKVVSDEERASYSGSDVKKIFEHERSLSENEENQIIRSIDLRFNLPVLRTSL